MIVPFNEGKFKMVHIGCANHHHQCIMDSFPLSDTQMEKDLDVHIDHELKFWLHTSTVATKTAQVLTFIRHSFALLTKFTLPLL